MRAAQQTRRDLTWKVIGTVALWLTSAAALFLTGARIVSTTIEWVKS